jgi:hypothetical protein
MGTFRPARSIAILACVALLAGACDSPKPSPAPSAAATQLTPPATSGPTGSDSPASSPAPDDTAGTSSQALIDADLASGAITLPQSLLYRAWAAFWDPRLPERYDGTGSTGEDSTLFDDIAAVLPTLNADQQAELRPYVLRPTDPASAWSAPESAHAGGAMLVAATPPPSKKCALPRRWYPQDWSPDGNKDHGFRAWACDADQKTAEKADNDLLAIAQKLWAPMTQPEPNGMGLPINDAGFGLNGASGADNGKVDIYMLDPLAVCRDRGGRCDTISGNTLASAATDFPSHCGVSGFPAKACTGYIDVPRNAISGPDFPGTLAHEFFHILQKSHNGKMDSRWYNEASAVWAEFHYVGDSNLFGGAIKQASRTDSLDRAGGYLRVQKSILRYGRGLPDQYQSWVWPLFQQAEGGPEAVFGSWQAMETVESTDDYDAAVESTLKFEDHFRDFAVRNAQPAPYVFGASTGLEADYWRTHLNLTDFPKDPRHTHGTWLPLAPGRTLIVTSIEASDAQYDGFNVIPDTVRQITIDLSGLNNDAFADLDVLGELTPTEDTLLRPEWKRIKASGGHIVLCRDQPAQNIDQLEVVVSNHAIGRTSDGLKPSPDLKVSGSYTIDAAARCQVPDHFSGSFSGSNGVDSWHGTATFDRIEPDALGGGCPPNGDQALYCYMIASGSVTWTADGATQTYSLKPPDASDGIQLIVSDARHPNQSGTYEIGLAPSTEIVLQGVHGPRYAFETVRAWINAIQYPKYPADWHLMGTESTGSGCGIDGCGTGATWNWNLTATFDP